ncbi:MAG: prolyl oligopeptidase family serine peptidase [Bacteroidota bacterium]|nr:prolyl oligopeptidase family serine peptidase [Bacteroidota bacterium]
MKQLFVISLLCSVILQSSLAQSSRFSYNQFISHNDTLHYRLLFPDANKLRKYPLVIFLHGSGERGSDNDAQLKWGVLNFATDENMAKFPAIVVAPQCPNNKVWANFSRSNMQLQPTPTQTMELVIGLIHELMQTMPVDTNRIYITGLSLGGYGTYDAIERYPNLFAAAVPVCGAGDTSKAATIAHIPIWIFHGAKDPVVNPNYSIEMATALTKAGAHPGLTLYPETGHFSWIPTYNNELMMQWLFRQHK